MSNLEELLSDSKKKKRKTSSDVEKPVKKPASTIRNSQEKVTEEKIDVPIIPFKDEKPEEIKVPKVSKVFDSTIVTFDIPEDLKPYLEVEDCLNFPISRYYVSKQQLEIIASIEQTQATAEEMHKLGLSYLCTTLLYGVPGTGKTTFARYMAYYYKIPFIYVNFAKIFDGVFGSTSRIISEIFRFMADKNCIFCLDEIDCISQKRGTEGTATGGEISRITVTLMQEFDIFRKKDIKCILIACTNRVEIMDPALKSRFSIAKDFKPLNNQEKEAYITLFLNDVGIPYNSDNVREYCSRTNTVRQRGVEADLNRCIADWIVNGKQEFILNHIREDRES